jgi:hypothetical protein
MDRVSRTIIQPLGPYGFLGRGEGATTAEDEFLFAAV